MPEEISEDERWRREACRVHGAVELADYEETPLGLSGAPNSHTDSETRSSRGTHGLTSHGAKMVRNGAWLLERRHGLRCCSFLTCTLPGLTTGQYDDVMESWSEILRVFNQRLGRWLSDRGLSPQVIYCVEIQSERWLNEGVAYPHIHALFQGRKRGETWGMRPDEFQRLWQESVSGQVPSTASLDWSKSTRVERPNKSLEGYLAKYLSKGSKEKTLCEGIGMSPPQIRSWWGGTGGIKKAIKKLIIRDTNFLADHLMYLIDVGAPGILFSRDIEMEWEGKDIWLGRYGRISQNLTKELQQLVREFRKYTPYTVPSNRLQRVV